jgi:hypothetical protein
VRECFARRAGTDGVEVEEVKRVTALFVFVEIGICGSGDDTLCDRLRVSLWCYGENVVRLITQF